MKFYYGRWEHPTGGVSGQNAYERKAVMLKRFLNGFNIKTGVSF